MISYETSIGRARIFQTDRHGGASSGQYGTANMADYFDDDPDAVQENRNRLARGVGIDQAEFCWMGQTHSANVAEAEPGVTDNTDALVTATPNRPLAALTADCAPVVLVAEDAVGIAHAGWPGLEKGVVQNAARALKSITSGEITAYLGPCIRPANYEFGREQLEELRAKFGDAVVSQTSFGTQALDLSECVKAALFEAGVENLIDCEIDTHSDDNYFSFRRDKVHADQATVVVLLPT